MNFDYFLMMIQVINFGVLQKNVIIFEIYNFSDVENLNKNVFFSFYLSKVIVENNFFKFYLGYSVSCIFVCDFLK